LNEAGVRPTYRVDSRRLRRERESLGLTQTALARQLGIGQPYLAKIESGRLMPPVRRLADICRALNLPVDAVLIVDQPVPS